MSGNFIIEAFCYGNVNDFPINVDDKFLRDVITTLKKQTNRSVKSLWCLVSNVKRIQNILTINSLKFMNFVRDLFDAIDHLFPTFVNNENINFDNPLMVKVFIVNEMIYSMDGYIVSGTNIDINIDKLFNKNFENLFRFINTHSIMTTYDIPFTLNEWRPKWTITYKENSLSNEIIDIYNDNFIMFSNIKFTNGMTDVLVKIHLRLLFLKENAPSYYNSLIDTYFTTFTHHVFDCYPYSEIMKSYLEFVSLTKRTYIPEFFNRESFNNVNLLFSVIPKQLASYICGFPIFSIGSLTQQQISNMSNRISKSPDDFFSEIEKKNRLSITSRIYMDKVGNKKEGESYINNLYMETESYNFDDIVLLFTSGFYFIFNFPEYKSITSNCINPYTRDSIDDKYLSNMNFIIISKSSLIKEVRNRGLRVELSGTMRENYKEVMEMIHENIPDTETNPYTSSNLFRLVFSNLIREDFSS